MMEPVKLMDAAVLGQLRDELLDGLAVGGRGNCIACFIEIPKASNIVEMGYNDESHKNKPPYYLRGVMRWACAHGLASNRLYQGVCFPGMQGRLEFHLYASASVSVPGMPEYGSGLMVTPGEMIYFTVVQGVFKYDERKTTITLSD